MKNPYNFFTSDYYTTTQIDELVYNITVSGVTQQQLDDAIVTFRTSDQIDVSYSAATSTFLTLDEINETGSGYTDGFISSSEIDSKVTDFTTEFLTPSEIDIIFSAHTENLATEVEAQSEIDDALEVSTDYWYPAPYYNRVFVTDSDLYELDNGSAGKTVDVIISGNTPWQILFSPVWTSESPSYGTGTTVMTLTTLDASGSPMREANLIIGCDDTAGTPKTLLIRQKAAVPPPD